MLTRQALEKNQVFIYLAAISIGLIIGIFLPSIGAALESALWLVLGVLLYTTFSQVPLTHLREVFAEPRLLIAATVGNFVLIPLVAWILMILAPDDPAVRLGVLLVLLVPCTDWFITFTQLGGGDTKRAIAFAPISLLLQIFLLPVYLWVFIGKGFTATLARGEMLVAFVGLILVPLIAAFITEKCTERSCCRPVLREYLGWLPVPLLAIVVFIIAISQVNAVIGFVSLLSYLLVVFSLFLVAAGWVAKAFAILFRLPPDQGRVLAFSFGTRNSFVVLPLALALPSSFELTVVVIVFQSLVELLGMVAYLWWVPKRLFPVPS
ncbi:MAG: arsenic resistance protein [Candidatus Brocadia sp.]